MKRKIVIIFLSVLSVLTLGMIIGRCFTTNNFKAYNPIPFVQKNAASWNLILVNHFNPIPDNYSIELVTLQNGRQVDSRIYSDLQQMFNDARMQGIYPIVGEGYRTTEEQQALLTEKIEAYLNEGYNEKEATKLAKEWVAIPGYSEHQIGLAVDINAEKSMSTKEEVYQWLAENAYQYGFILRYPEGKENFTGTTYEPWHYRYVGKEAALEIYSKRLCLEEYLQMED